MLFVMSLLFYLLFIVSIVALIELSKDADKKNCNGLAIVAIGVALFACAPFGFCFFSSFYLLFIYNS